MGVQFQKVIRKQIIIYSLYLWEHIFLCRQGDMCVSTANFLVGLRIVRVKDDQCEEEESCHTRWFMERERHDQSDMGKGSTSGGWAGDSKIKYTTLIPRAESVGCVGVWHVHNPRQRGITEHAKATVFLFLSDVWGLRFE